MIPKLKKAEWLESGLGFVVVCRVCGITRDELITVAAQTETQTPPERGGHYPAEIVHWELHGKNWWMMHR